MKHAIQKGTDADSLKDIGGFFTRGSVSYEEENPFLRRLLGKFTISIYL